MTHECKQSEHETKKQWHAEDIKAAVRKTGKTLKELAADNGLHESTVSKALHTPSKSGEKAISEYLCVPLHELFPQRWTEDGKRIRPRYATNYSKNGVATL